MTDDTLQTESRPVPVWQPVIMAALAGGMGWGIRGQYGHETGAMIAGVLVSLVIAFLLCPRAASLPVARAVAFGAIAMGFGGTMTYGQTLGLTQNPEVIGNAAAWRWGLMGCAVKGGIWIGFAGAFLGMGLGGERYRAREMVFLMLAAIGAYLIGYQVLNQPMDLRGRELPAIYFSAPWDLYPNDPDLRPRPESWGGLLFALATVLVYAGWHREDRLAVYLGLWGMIGGAIGFPLGQSLQSYHAWHPEVFDRGIWETLDPHMNWWNWMESTFGFTMGAALGFGAWLHRGCIRPAATGHTMPLPVEGILIAVHVALLVSIDFIGWPRWVNVYDLGLVMGVLPLAAVAGGRAWPYLLTLPVTMVPIAGKTIKNTAYDSDWVTPVFGWAVFVVVPIAVATAAAAWFACRARTHPPAVRYTFPALLFCTWTYFLLNWCVFRFPWPWADWTNRTPNGIFFTICAAGITIIAIARYMQTRAVGESRL